MRAERGRTASAEGGFTLLELLLALAITALIGAASYAALDGVNRSRLAFDAKAQQLGSLQRFFNVFGTDVRQAAGFASRGVDGEREAAFAVSDGADAALVLNRRGWHNPLRTPRSELQRVYYRFDGDSVVRGYWQALDRVASTPSRERVLLTGVKSMRVRVLPAAQLASIERGWVERWPPANEDEQRPAAVEIALELDNLGGITRIYELLPQ